MCKSHWNQYTAGLAREAKARKAANPEAAVPDPEPSDSKPSRAKGKAKEPVVAVADGGAV